MSAEHEVTVEWTPDGSVSYSFRCNAEDYALCQAVYPGDRCEEYNDSGVDEDGRPWHSVTELTPDGLSDHEVKHYGHFERTECNYRDWFENSDEVLRGSVTFAVKGDWDGNGFTFEVVK